MEITRELFERIEKLAKLRFNNEEKEKMMSDMSEIISWVKKLEELDTEGVNPLTNMSHEINVMRKDENTTSLDRDIVLKNAPNSEDGFIRVPKVID